jgi:hypothetical protein
MYSTKTARRARVFQQSHIVRTVKMPSGVVVQVIERKAK